MSLKTYEEGDTADTELFELRMPEEEYWPKCVQQSAAPAAPVPLVWCKCLLWPEPSCRGGDRHNPAIGAGDTLYTAYFCHCGAFQDCRLILVERKGRMSSADQRIKKAVVSGLSISNTIHPRRTRRRYWRWRTKCLDTFQFPRSSHRQRAQFRSFDWAAEEGKLCAKVYHRKQTSLIGSGLIFTLDKHSAIRQNLVTLIRWGCEDLITNHMPPPGVLVTTSWVMAGAHHPSIIPPPRVHISISIWLYLINWHSVSTQSPTAALHVTRVSRVFRLQLISLSNLSVHHTSHQLLDAARCYWILSRHLT